MTELTVLQSVKRWLPRTQKWLHRQVVGLPESIETKVACRETLNLEEFRIPRISQFNHQVLGVDTLDWLLDEARKSDILERAVDAWELRRWVQWRARVARGVDVIHSHFGHIGWQDIEVARRSGAHHVTTFYGYDLSLLPSQQPIWEERYPELFSSVDLVLCEGPHMRETAIELGCPPEKAEVHHLGVNIDEIEYRERESSDGPVRFLIASSFKPKKGIPDAVEALGRLRGEFDFELTVIGDATHIARSKEEKARIEAKIDEHDLWDVISFLGFLPYDELLEQMLAHDVFLVPSRTSFRGDSEGGAPVTMITAQATGMPVVGSKHADIPNVVIDDETGLLAPERDVDALTEKLRRIATERDRWSQMGRAARDRIEREFNAERQSRRLAQHYRSLLVP